jgi:predicted 3-demethylubiquinone-9 3-methyltransferase (glyoxalase superfamily)
VQKITPFLWFDGKAEEAMNYYVSVFKNSKVVRVSRYGDAGPGPKGTVMSATFQLDGQEFFALNGGPQFTFTPAISFFVNCETQQEVDELWDKLSAGGRKDRCGWLQDRFGVSWQVIPSILGKLLQDNDTEKANRVMKAMLQMDKIEIKRLQRHTTEASSAPENKSAPSGSPHSGTSCSGLERRAKRAGELTARSPGPVCQGPV